MKCIYCETQTKHPLFVYLLSDKRCVNSPFNHKVVPYIGLASNPFTKLCAHNRMGKQFGHGSQLTKLGAGHYQLELVYGPMFSGGRQFKKLCRMRSRKIVSRILHFCDYARSLQRTAKRTAHSISNAHLYVRDQSMIRDLYRQRQSATNRSK